MRIDKLDQILENQQEQLIALVQRLVAIPSISGEEAAVQQVIAEEMAALGLQVDQWCPTVDELKDYPAFGMVDARGLGSRPNVVGTLSGSGKGRSLVINGHADVVPEGDASTWEHHPWQGTLKDGKLYGRGSCDMKGNLAVALYVLCVLQEAGIKLQGDVQLWSVIGEETGGVGTLAAIARGHRGDAAIILEPTNLEIVPAQAGAATFRLTVPGKAAHGSMRNEGVNPVEKFIRLHTAMLELEQRRNDEFQHPFFQGVQNKIPLSIGTVQSGIWHSSVPDRLVAEGRYGVRVGETIEEAQAELAKSLQQVSSQDEWLSKHLPILEWIEGQFESTEIDADERVLQELATACRDVLQQEPRLRGVTYGSDMRLLVNHAGIPSVLFGAGDIRTAHAADEFIEVDELVTLSKVLLRLILSWCGYSE